MEKPADLLDLLYELLESVLTSKNLVKPVLAVVAHLSRFQRGAVLVENDRDRLELQTHVGFSLNGLKSIEYLYNKALAPASGRLPSLVTVADTRKDEKFKRLSGLRTSDILSLACIPLRVEDRRVGILYLDSTLGARSFSSKDLERLNRFSKLITDALIRSQEIRSPLLSISDYLAEHSIDGLQRDRLITILERNNWRGTRACRPAGVPQRTVYYMMLD
jgi:transcriptional regulator with GAF, ATPase, and Fis domain